MEKEGRPTVERGTSTLRTRPEFPTFPFHFDLPICTTQYKRELNHLDYETKQSPFTVNFRNNSQQLVPIKFYNCNKASNNDIYS